jgi:hypothetical protein
MGFTSFCKNYPIERNFSGIIRIFGVVANLASVSLRRKLNQPVEKLFAELIKQRMSLTVR